MIKLSQISRLIQQQSFKYCSKRGSRMKHLQSKQKPITGKKITYTSTINQKSPKATRQANEFQLIYKIKNRENQNHEDSYQSMIMLKSKNKIKRYRYASDKDKQKQKSKNESTNIKDVFDRINNKIQQHSKKTSPRLINLLSMSSGSPRSYIVGDQKVNSKRNKQKSKNKIDKVDMTISSRPHVIKSQKILRKVRKPLESHIVPKQPSPRDQTEYIMFDDEIHPIAQQTHKNLASLMKSTYDKSKLTLNNLQPYSQKSQSEQNQQQQHQQFSEQIADEEQQYYPIYEHSATQIQKIWRGYKTRKQLNQQKQSIDIQKVNEIRMQTSVNGMFIQLFQQIVDLDQEEAKVQLLKAFRQVLNKNRSSIHTVSSKFQNNVSLTEQRQEAVQSQFQAQTNILKYLLSNQHMSQQDYSSKVQDLSKWGALKRDEVTKLSQTIEQINTKTNQLKFQTSSMNDLLQLVQSKKSPPSILIKCFQQIQKQILSYSFYENEPARQSSVAHHLPTEQNQPPSQVKILVQQIEVRQNIKNQIEKRMLQQLGYFNAQMSPVNTSSIGIHLFLSDILNYIEEYYRDDFLRWINMPYGYSSESRLKLLQGYDIKVGQENMGLVEGVQNVLSIQILLEYHKQIYTQAQLFNIYHQRAIFDAFNECLNVYRPYYSIKGPPYLWNNSEKALTFYFIAQQNIEQVFQKTKQQILKHASSLCGILSDEHVKSQSFDDLMKLKHGCHQMISECRDQKLTRMQHQTVFSNEGDWSLIEQQKTQTMLNITELVLSEIIKQMAEDIKILRNQINN